MGRALPRLLKILFIAALIICSCSVCAKAILEGSVDTRNPLLEVTFLDIEGDATFIKTPGGRTILIDGGRKQIPSKLLSVLYEKLPPENTGPWRSAQRRIDVVVLTNPTPDHIGGLIQVLENDDIDVGQVIYPGIPYTSPTYKHFLSLVKENHIPYYMITGGEKLNWDPLLKVDVLSPSPGVTYYKGKKRKSLDLNNNSIVLKITYNKVSFLLTSDIEEAACCDLTELGEILRSTIVKLSHHGSITSSTEGFIRMIRPELALLNIGVDNKYVYPIEDVIERYKKIGTKVYCADTYNTLIIGENGMKPTHNGTITFLTDGKRYEIKAENNLDEIQAELERARTSPQYRFPEISKEELAKEIPQENIDVSLILDGEYLDKVQSIINHAEESIYMIMFAVKPGKRGGNQVNKLLQELIAARRRGVRVKIILERSQTNKGFVAGANRVAYNIFAQEGLDVKFDFPKIKTHDKLLIIDREIVVIGSHNWTKAGLDGTQNEASVLIKSRAVAQKYLRYFYEYKWAEGPKERAEKRPQKRRRR